MTDIMKLADNYANACADVREFLGANAGMDEADGTWIASQQARAALQSAVEALQGEVEQVKGFWKEAQLRNRNLLEEGNDLAMLADQYKAERAALQAKLDAMGKGEPVATVQQYGEGVEAHLHSFLPIGTKLYAAPKALAPDVDWLSNVIRQVDGNNKLGAGALAEKIVEAISAPGIGDAP